MLLVVSEQHLASIVLFCCSPCKDCGFLAVNMMLFRQSTQVYNHCVELADCH